MKGQVYIRGASPIDVYGVDTHGEYVRVHRETYVTYREKPYRQTDYPMKPELATFLNANRTSLQNAISKGVHHIVVGTDKAE